MEGLVVNFISRSDSLGDQSDEGADRSNSSGTDSCDRSDEHSLSADGSGSLSDADNAAALLSSDVLLEMDSDHVPGSLTSVTPRPLTPCHQNLPESIAGQTSNAGVNNQSSSSNGATSWSSSGHGGAGSSRCKLLHEGDIQLCRLNHTRTIVSKIMNSKYLRRWESHHLVLSNGEIRSLTVGTEYSAIFLLSKLAALNISKYCLK